MYAIPQLVSSPLNPFVYFDDVTKKKEVLTVAKTFIAPFPHGELL